MGIAAASSQLQTGGSQTTAASTAQSGTSLGFWGTIEADVSSVIQFIGSGIKSEVNNVNAAEQSVVDLGNKTGRAIQEMGDATAKAIEWGTIAAIVGVILLIAFLIWQAPKILAAL